MNVICFFTLFIYRINSSKFLLLDQISSFSDTYSFHKTCYDDAHTKTYMSVMLCENIANIYIIVCMNHSYHVYFMYIYVIRLSINLSYIVMYEEITALPLVLPYFRL